MEDMRYTNLKNRIHQDMAPVHALAPAWRRASGLFWICLVLIGVVLAVFGLRYDYGALGSAYLCCQLLSQLLAAYAVIILALRLTVPGSAPASAILVCTVIFGACVHLTLSAITLHLSRTDVEPGREGSAALVCFVITLCLSMLPFALALVLASRGLPSRPAVLGLACGFGCGLAGEAVWRMHCPYNAWDHILVSHSGAVVAAAVVGWVVSSLYFRRRQRLREK